MTISSSRQPRAANGETVPVLEIRDLRLGLQSGGIKLVHGVSLEVRPGEIVGVVGESGSGKTLTGRAVIGLEPPGIRRLSGSVLVGGRDISGLTRAELRELRGEGVGFIFQDPMTSLNPSTRIGLQLDEALRLHGRGTRAERRAAVLDILAKVGIPDPEQAWNAWPHEFSGGMRQRIMIASAMLLKPRLIVADEPTTALDAIVQRGVMELLLDLARSQGSAVLLISHDLPMVAHYCGRIYVMKDGRVVETAPTAQLLDKPRDPYTRMLLGAIPVRPDRPPPPAREALVDVRGLKVEYTSGSHLFGGRRKKLALSGIDLTIGPAEVVAVVGQSGSGKTTLGKAIAGLLPTSGGSIVFKGASIDADGKLPRAQRLDLQFIFQDPHSSLDPRMTVGQLLSEPLRHDRLSAERRRALINEALIEVGLLPEHAARYPHQMSGGQKQRVAIARAIIRRPAFIVADEAVSALDVTVRAQVLKLFAELQRKHGFSCLFVSHDLGAVEEIADRVVVMRNGGIVEQGDVAQIFDEPKTDYTRQLLSALPVLKRNESGVRLGWRALAG